MLSLEMPSLYFMVTPGIVRLIPGLLCPRKKELWSRRESWFTSPSVIQRHSDFRVFSTLTVCSSLRKQTLHTKVWWPLGEAIVVPQLHTHPCTLGFPRLELESANHDSTLPAAPIWELWLLEGACKAGGGEGTNSFPCAHCCLDVCEQPPSQTSSLSRSSSFPQQRVNPVFSSPSVCRTSHVVHP